MSQLLDLLKTAERTVALAGELIESNSAHERTITGKGDRDFATDVDFAVEDGIRRYLASETPDIPLLGEERGYSGSAPMSYQWVIDPIDGTVNFAHGSPLYSVSLALLHQGVPVAGVVAAPALNETYSAARGHGAFLNDQAISPSDVSSLSDALVSLGDFAVGHHATEKNAERFALVQELVPRIQRMRMIGSAALDLCWVAAGRLDATVVLSTHLWDIGAGVVIATEAGAAAVDRYGAAIDSESTSVVACPKSLKVELVEVLKPIAGQDAETGE